jgi:hypothetical protein
MNAMKNVWGKLMGVAAGVLPLFVFAQTALAQGTSGQTQNITLTDPLGGSETFTTVVNSVAGFLFYYVATPLCVIMVLVGAFQMITSSGDPEKISQARKTLIYATIGFGVALLAGSVTTLITSILNGQ